MTLLILLAGLILLALPALRGKREHFSYRPLPMLEIDLRGASWWRAVRAALAVPGFWYDLIRGLAGAECVRWAAREADAGALGRLPSEAVLALATLAGAVAFVLSRSHCRDLNRAPAPVALVTGVVAAICPVPVSVFALVIAVTVGFAFKSLEGFFNALAVALCLLGGVLLPAPDSALAGAAFASVAPFGATVLRLQLALPVRRWRGF